MFNFFVLFCVVDLKQVQTKGIGDNAEAGQAHGSCSEHRVQRQSQGDEHPSSQGDANGVIEEGPEQVLVDVPQSSPAETDGRRHVAEPALHQHHIGRVNGNIGTGTDGDAGVRTRQAGASLMPSPTMATSPLGTSAMAGATDDCAAAASRDICSCLIQ